jgi:hypothetical protein
LSRLKDGLGLTCAALALGFFYVAYRLLNPKGIK